MNKAKIAVLAATAATVGLTLTACGNAGGSSANSDSKTIKVAASATPHAEILEEAKPILKGKRI